MRNMTIPTPIVLNHQYQDMVPFSHPIIHQSQTNTYVPSIYSISDLIRENTPLHTPSSLTHISSGSTSAYVLPDWLKNQPHTWAKASVYLMAIKCTHHLRLRSQMICTHASWKLYQIVQSSFDHINRNSKHFDRQVDHRFHSLLAIYDLDGPTILSHHKDLVPWIEMAEEYITATFPAMTDMMTNTDVQTHEHRLYDWRVDRFLEHLVASSPLEILLSVVEIPSVGQDRKLFDHPMSEGRLRIVRRRLNDIRSVYPTIREYVEAAFHCLHAPVGVNTLGDYIVGNLSSLVNRNTIISLPSELSTSHVTTVGMCAQRSFSSTASSDQHQSADVDCHCDMMLVDRDEPARISRTSSFVPLGSIEPLTNKAIRPSHRDSAMSSSHSHTPAHFSDMTMVNVVDSIGSSSWDSLISVIPATATAAAASGSSALPLTVRKRNLDTESANMAIPPTKRQKLLRCGTFITDVQSHQILPSSLPSVDVEMKVSESVGDDAMTGPGSVRQDLSLDDSETGHMSILDGDVDSNDETQSMPAMPLQSDSSVGEQVMQTESKRNPARVSVKRFTAKKHLLPAFVVRGKQRSQRMTIKDHTTSRHGVPPSVQPVVLSNRLANSARALPPRQMPRSTGPPPHKPTKSSLSRVEDIGSSIFSTLHRVLLTPTHAVELVRPFTQSTPHQDWDQDNMNKNTKDEADDRWKISMELRTKLEAKVKAHQAAIELEALSADNTIDPTSTTTSSVPSSSTVADALRTVLSIFDTAPNLFAEMQVMRASIPDVDMVRRDQLGPECQWLLRVADAIRHVDNPMSYPILPPNDQQKLSDSAAMLKESGFATLLGLPSIVELSKEWQNTLHGSTHKAGWSNLKSHPGTVSSQQCDAKAISESLTTRVITLFEKLLPLLGLVDPSLKVRVAKILRSNPGAGPQILHTDVPSQARFLHPNTRQTQSKQQHSFAIIVHLDETSFSTHVPNPVWSSKGDFSLTTACNETYTSYTMAGGDIMVFRSDLPHAGPANPSNQTRYVLFLMVTPEVGEDQDAKQTYFKCS